MGFLAPWFLAGLGLAGLPVWLHLLRQHRSVPLPFSSLMFFERRTVSSVRHRRLRYLLLFALRLALICLLPLLFANPYLKQKATPGSRGERLYVAAIDNSFSMRQGGRLDRAKQEARNFVAALPGASKAQVVSLAGGLRVLTQPVSDKSELRAAIDSIETSDAAGSFGELARGLRSLAQSAQTPLEVHLYSDFQRSSLPPSFADLSLGPAIRLVPHPAARGATPNLAVESATAPRRIYGTGKAKVQAVIAGYGTPASSRQVSMVVDGRTLETKPVNVPAGGRAAVEFLSLEAGYGFHRGEIRLAEDDAFPDDNRYLFSVERADPRRVLFLHDARNGRAVLYYRTALESTASNAFVMEAMTLDRAASASLEKYAFVILSDASILPESFEQQLNRYVRSGGGLLALIGPAAAARQRVPVFDEAVEGTQYSSRGAERFQSVAFRDDTHPVLRRVRGIEAVRFYQSVRVAEGKGRVLARLADGAPLLMEEQVGEGRVLVFASTFDNIANDLPIHPAFVALVEQSARYLARDDDSSSGYTVGGYVELRSGKDRATTVEVIDPLGRRALSLAESASAQTYQLPSQGYFELRRTGRQSLIAVNPDRRESDLEPAPEEALVLWQNTGQGTGAGAQGTEPEANAETRRSFWRYLAVLLLVAIAAESLVGSQYLSQEAEEIILERREAA